MNCILNMQKRCNENILVWRILFKIINHLNEINYHYSNPIVKKEQEKTQTTKEKTIMRELQVVNKFCFISRGNAESECTTKQNNICFAAWIRNLYNYEESGKHCEKLWSMNDVIWKGKKTNKIKKLPKRMMWLKRWYIIRRKWLQWFEEI